jgi:hypothetical protein
MRYEVAGVIYLVSCKPYATHDAWQTKPWNIDDDECAMPSDCYTAYTSWLGHPDMPRQVADVSGLPFNAVYARILRFHPEAEAVYTYYPMYAGEWFAKWHTMKKHEQLRRFTFWLGADVIGAPM